MGSFSVSQRTKDGMFYATSLMKQWNTAKKSKKEVNDFIRLKSTSQYLETLKTKEEFKNGESPVLKTRGKYAGTWMHPFLFIDFAMWINPDFKYDVIKFVYDELIKNRHDAGDHYKILSSAGKNLKGYNYASVAKALQWIVFNKTGKELRQKATTEQLKELTEIQQKLAFSIDMGYIKSFNDLVEQLRKIYLKKYNNKKLSA